MEGMLPSKKARKPYELVALLLLMLGVAGLWMGSKDFNKGGVEVSSEKVAVSSASAHIGNRNQHKTSSANTHISGKIDDRGAAISAAIQQSPSTEVATIAANGNNVPGGMAEINNAESIF